MPLPPGKGNRQIHCTITVPGAVYEALAKEAAQEYRTIVNLLTKILVDRYANESRPE